MEVQGSGGGGAVVCPLRDGLVEQAQVDWLGQVVVLCSAPTAPSLR